MHAPASSGGASFSIVWVMNIARVVGLASGPSRRAVLKSLLLDIRTLWI